RTANQKVELNCSKGRRNLSQTVYSNVTTNLDLGVGSRENHAGEPHELWIMVQFSQTDNQPTNSLTYQLV
ncbi:hypothetical protein N9B43_08095, partial [Mariniblastus sp.]|nr:hypothetical protein [Mariniblastus sp.]